MPMMKMPAVTIGRPIEGSELNPGSTVFIKWQYRRVKNILIEVSDDGGSTWTEITQTPTRRRKYEWTTPSTTGSYQIRISSLNNSEVNDVVNFTIPEPHTDLLVPARDYFIGGQTYPLYWVSTGAPTTVHTYCSFVYHNVPPYDGNYAFQNQTTATGNTNWNVPDITTDNGWLRLTCENTDLGFSAISDALPINVVSVMDFTFVTSLTTVNADGNPIDVSVTSSNAQPNPVHVFVSLRHKDFYQYTYILQATYQSWVDDASRPNPFTFQLNFAQAMASVPSGTYQAKLKVTCGQTSNLETYAGVSNTFTLVFP